MITVASRDLRNHTADVLRQVEDGATVAITVHGRIVAELSPPRGHRKAYFTRDDMRGILATSLADPGLRDDLAELGQMTDELDWPE